MFTNFVFHFTFQVCLATTLFWLLLLPVTIAKANKQVKKYIARVAKENSLREDQKQKVLAVASKEQILQGVSAQQDIEGYRQNNRIFFTSMLVVFALVVTGVIIIAASKNRNILPTAMGILLTYMMVCLVQVLFLFFVIMKYDTEGIDKYLVSSFDRHCSAS